ITDIDPIRYDLLFERFLNPERVSMPDIDVDFCYERRQEVIDYVVQTYGKDDVAQIITFGTMAAKGVIRDVGRVLDIPYAKCDQIAKMVPGDLGMTLSRALEISPDLKKAYAEDTEVKYLIDMSLRLEGLPRHTSMHAAGVLIARTNVDEYVPLARNQDGAIVTQFTMTTLEELGLLKMDFLGLRTLTVIRHAILQAEENYGVHIDLDQIDYADKKVFEMISRGETSGVFQLESAGMTSFMKELKPETIDDIIAGLSLYRPGPMDFIPRYIKGKNNKADVVYECPELEPILKTTYGCIVYQEQVMQIVQKLAGYSLGRADLVRRAMSKKKASVMLKERQNFIYGNPEEGVAGCVANGIPEAVANRIFDEMTDFASYAFNKSHAAAYAVVSYQTAWLKYYYPAEFMAALMTSVIDNINKISEYIQTSRQMGLKIAAPDINRGSYGFLSAGGKAGQEGGEILYGLSAIKGVGRTVVEEIAADRKEHGVFLDLEDFISRMQQSVNRKATEYLIKAGAFDCFPGNRRQKIEALPEMIDRAGSRRKSGISGQMSLFDLADEAGSTEFKVQLPPLPEYDKETLLAYEKEATGLYISGHPIESYLDSYQRIVNTVSSSFSVSEDTGRCPLSDGQRVICGGVVEDLKLKITKNNRQMCFLTIGDLYGQFEAIVFPNVFERIRPCLRADAKLYLAGHVSIDSDESAKLVVDNAAEFDKLPKEVWIAFEDRTAYQAAEASLSELCLSHVGISDVYVYLRKERAKKKLPAAQRLEVSEETLEALRGRFGEKNVKVVEKALDLRA
ncbi:MAG: DNA polymerase III subunit alpha, partial [Eubacteriales bacterium]|nr:DNA polymerase III subunit alpha [Eubacteriales bacterium]